MTDSLPEAIDPDDDDDDTTPDTSRSERIRQARIARTGGTVAAASGPQAPGQSLTKSGMPKRLLAQQKRRDAVELRKMGVSFQVIADTVGYNSEREASRQVRIAMDRLEQEPVRELHKMQIERLNALLMVAWPQARQGSLPAMQTALAIMARIDALSGTESAKQVQVTSTSNTNIISVTASEDEFIAGMKRLAGINPDGTNAGTSAPQQAVMGPNQVITIAPSTPTVAARQYPPGMGPQAKPVELEAVVYPVKTFSITPDMADDEDDEDDEDETDPS